MRLNVNPNRMELFKLKKRLVLARRGHKLLKDKQDELMRIFLELFDKVYKERITIEKLFEGIYQRYGFARAQISLGEHTSATVLKDIELRFTSTVKPLFNLRIPILEVSISGDVFWWSSSYMSFEFDDAAFKFRDFIQRLIKLSNDEKTLKMLSEEIERTRRRVNALEYILIPNLIETIKYISMRLSENERGDIVRLMKVKELVRSH